MAGFNDDEKSGSKKGKRMKIPQLGEKYARKIPGFQKTDRRKRSGEENRL